MIGDLEEVTIDNGIVDLKFVTKERYDIDRLVGALEDIKDRYIDDNEDEDSIHALAFAIHMIENRDKPTPKSVEPPTPVVHDYYKINMIKAVRQYAITLGLGPREGEYDTGRAYVGLKEAKEMVEFAIAANEEAKAQARLQHNMENYTPY